MGSQESNSKNKAARAFSWTWEAGADTFWETPNRNSQQSLEDSSKAGHLHSEERCFGQLWGSV